MTISEIPPVPPVSTPLIAENTQELLVFSCRCGYQSISRTLSMLGFEIGYHIHTRHHDGYQAEDVKVDRFVRT